MNVAELLTIDVASEIRKLTASQLATPEEAVVVAVRSTLEAGAQEVRIELGRNVSVLQARGARLPDGQLRELALLLDPAKSSGQRHQALVEWEARYGLAWLALFSRPRAKLTANTGTRRVTLSTRDCVLLAHEDVPSAEPPSLRVELERARSAAELEHVARACRYASVPIVVDGERVSRGLSVPDALLEVNIEADGVSGVVALPSDGGYTRSIVLRSQVVERESYRMSRDGLVFTVLLDAPARSTELELVVRAARDRLYGELKRRFADLLPTHQEAARELLFRVCEHRGDTTFIAGAALFLRADGASVDIETLRSAVRGGVLTAVDPRERRRVIDAPHTVYVLGGRERELLRKLFGLSCVAPGVVSRRPLLARLATACSSVARAVARRAGDALRFGIGVLDEKSLTPAEAAFLSAVRAELAASQFRFEGSANLAVVPVARGRLPCRVRREHGVALLPLRTAAARALVAAHQREPKSLYMVMAVLFGGVDGYAARKARWQGAWLAAR